MYENTVDLVVYYSLRVSSGFWEDLVLERPELDIQAVNWQLASTNATRAVEWASETFGQRLVMSTSFGIQAAVMLHLVTRVVPDIPVIWIDTGYLIASTYVFAEQLTELLKLNLKVYQSPISPARMEAVQGRLWAQDNLEALNRYDQLRKVEPMQRALRELEPKAWLAGLRSEQTDHRKKLQFVNRELNFYKVLPILRWTTKDVHEYLQAHHLPLHPLHDKGYATVGDWHSSRPLTAADKNERDTRFHGIKQECGLHLPQTLDQEKSLNSSKL